MIGIFGTSDVENYGDLLYPLVFDHLLRRCGSAVATRAYAFLPGPAPAAAGYNTHAIADLLRAPGRLVDALWIGGGDILRTDTRTIASHYVEQFASRPECHLFWRLRRWISGDRVLAKAFISTFIRYACAGPMLLDATRYAQVSPIAYWSCGVPFEFTAAEHEAVRSTMATAAAIYVRDSASAARLRRAGVTRPVHVAPDAVVTLSDLYPIDEMKSAGRRLFASHGVDVARRIVGFQVVALAPDVLTEVAMQLRRHVDETGDEVVLLPIGHCHGDRLVLAELARACSGAARLIPLRRIDEIVAGIATCDAFVGTSLHGNVTAFSFGVPHLAGPLAVGKLQGFIDVVGLDAEASLTEWRHLGERLRRLMSRRDDSSSSKLERAKAAVYRTFADMLATLGLAGSGH